MPEKHNLNQCFPDLRFHFSGSAARVYFYCVVTPSVLSCRRIWQRASGAECCRNDSSTDCRKQWHVTTPCQGSLHQWWHDGHVMAKWRVL